MPALVKSQEVLLAVSHEPDSIRGWGDKFSLKITAHSNNNNHKNDFATVEVSKSNWQPAINVLRRKITRKK